MRGVGDALTVMRLHLNEPIANNGLDNQSAVVREHHHFITIYESVISEA